MGHPLPMVVMVDENGRPLQPDAAARALADSADGERPSPRMKIDQEATAQAWERRRTLRVELFVVAVVSGTLAAAFLIGSVCMKAYQAQQVAHPNAGS
jgi:hypothetical protein